MTEDERARALSAIEDAIDATAEYRACGCLVSSRDTAGAVLDRLIELGWSKS